MNKDEAIRLEQAHYTLRNMPIGATAVAVAVWLIAHLFRDTEVRVPMLIWAGLFTGGVVWALIDYRSWKPLMPGAAEKWLRHIPISCGTASALFGSAAFIVVQAPLGEGAIAYLFLLLVISVVSIFCYGPHYPTFVGMTAPLIVLTVIAFGFGDEAVEWVASASAAVLLVAVLYFARTFNRVFRRSIDLRFENRDLVEQLQKQILVAESANTAKSRFLAAASHDLRQPMHALNLYLDALAGVKSMDQARPLLQNASECARAMDEMFASLLDVSSLEAGVVQPEINVFPIASILDRLRLEFTPAAQAKGLELRVVSSSVFVRSDPAMLERVAANFVSNAVRYTRSGKILVGCRRRKHDLQLVVLDTGPGIAEDKQALVFEEFYQLENPGRDRTQGIGLGLAIVRRLARILGGQVTLRSVAGKGSAFAIEVARADVLAMRPAESGAGKMAEQENLRGAFVVVVDDEKFVLDATRVVLEQAGCLVLAASSGPEALRQLGHSKRIPDAIVCDYRLRAGEKGVDTVESLREEFNADIPAVLITGDTAVERLLELDASGLNVLHKPVREKELLAVLNGMLEGRDVESDSAAA